MIGQTIPHYRMIENLGDGIRRGTPNHHDRERRSEWRV